VRCSGRVYASREEALEAAALPEWSEGEVE
jgi:hypothetical protein